MSKVLFLGVPSHGHVNPTLGLVNELVKQGEDVIYFSSPAFKEKIEATGATFAAYAADLDIFKAKKEGDPPFAPMIQVLKSADEIIADILYQIKDLKIDYLIHSAAFPFTKVIAQLLKVPTVSSLAIFAGLKAFLDDRNDAKFTSFPGAAAIVNAYQQVKESIHTTYGVTLPPTMRQLIFNTGDINLIYTSKYFAPDTEDFDDSYKFVGPPIYTRKEAADFPLALLKDKQVIYISLGTVFSNFNQDLYKIFFESFADMNVVVVMAAYQVDLSTFNIPANFIVRNFVPQSEILQYTDVAITHAGMNSISDLVNSNIPFVAIPLGADQPLMAKRAEELGAAVALDARDLTVETLRQAVKKVWSDPSYLENLKKISDSFKAAGGYGKAVEEIFKLKKARGINN